MGAVQFFSIVLPAAFWPAAVVIIAWWQRVPITRLLNRIRSGKLFGQEFDTSAPAELEDAAGHGASSPAVERLVAEAQQAGTGSPTEPSGSAAWFARLAEAQQSDEARRQADIERIIRSAARWGARMVHHAGTRPEDLNPVVTWSDSGDPIITASDPRTRKRREAEEALAEVERCRSIEGSIKAELAALRAGADPDAATLREVNERETALRQALEAARAQTRKARDQLLGQWQEREGQD